jgi:hypothetical protein
MTLEPPQAGKESRNSPPYMLRVTNVTDICIALRPTNSAISSAAALGPVAGADRMFAGPISFRPSDPRITPGGSPLIERE